MNSAIADSLAPKARRVFMALGAEIEAGSLPQGAKLPGNGQLAARYGVSAVTMRNVLNHLQKAGLVSIEHGRGTFVRVPSPPSVLVVDDDPDQRLVLRAHVAHRGYAVLEAADPASALACLEDGGSDVAMIFSDVHMPDAASGVDFIRAVRRRWPHIPLAAVTAYATDLNDLRGTPDCPILIIAKPVRGEHIAEALAMGVRPR